MWLFESSKCQTIPAETNYANTVPGFAPGLEIFAPQYGAKCEVSPKVDACARNWMFKLTSDKPSAQAQPAHLSNTVLVALAFL